MTDRSSITICQSDDLSPLTFEGGSGEECETFIHAVHNLSRNQGRSADDAWIVDLARASFVGPALRWYAGLPEAMQTNWRALRSALLRHYQPQAEVLPDEEDDPRPAAPSNSEASL